MPTAKPPAVAATPAPAVLTAAAQLAPVTAGLDLAERQLEAVSDRLAQLDLHYKRALALWQRRFWLTLLPLLGFVLRYFVWPRLAPQRRRATT